MNTEWTKKSWQNFNYYQKANWYDTKLLADVLQELSKLPALVFAGETRSLKKDLIDISRGDAFLLQCGDCSESFVDCQGPRIHNLIRIILQMSMIITYITNKRVVKIGRIAGQYAKPRSNEFEIVDNVQLPIYRGDMINSFLPAQEYRKHDPKRILEAYYKSAATLNLIRAFTKGGYASLQSITDWQKHYFKNFPIMDKYSEIVINITKAINFMKA
ncbi:MAG TPA: 3-deoxy-7-phosphoheptulonate synthase, partial [Spirochaetota bacterium]|nr:3-deoxy-7-phosphoheptulonate synthase [Spirochaetota bacterium]